MKRFLIAAGLWLAATLIGTTIAVLLASAAQAQQRTIYDHTGKAVGRETTDTQGTRTFYGSDGKAFSRATKDGTVYDAPSGRVLGKVTKDKR